tara:strand:- start:18 stop:329 length:312 start_codon:yes stop_codon:yes gene_type:complete
MKNDNIIYVVVFLIFIIFIGGGLYLTDKSEPGLYIIIFSGLFLVCFMVFKCIDSLFDKNDNDSVTMNTAIIPEESEVYIDESPLSYIDESPLSSSYSIIEEEI